MRAPGSFVVFLLAIVASVGWAYLLVLFALWLAALELHVRGIVLAIAIAVAAVLSIFVDRIGGRDR